MHQASNNNLRLSGTSRAKVNFVKENIKRAGVSKEKFGPKSHRDKGFESTGQPGRTSNVMSPKASKDVYVINSLGSIGSMGSPVSPTGNRQLIAGRKNFKKLRQKDAYGATSTVANFYG
jgi:hypothetical protein